MDKNTISNVQHRLGKKESLLLMESFFLEFSPEMASEILAEWSDIKSRKENISLETKDLEKFNHFFNQFNKLVLSVSILLHKVPSS